MFWTPDQPPGAAPWEQCSGHLTSHPAASCVWFPARICGACSTESSLGDLGKLRKNTVSDGHAINCSSCQLHFRLHLYVNVSCHLCLCCRKNVIGRISTRKTMSKKQSFINSIRTNTMHLIQPQWHGRNGGINPRRFVE